MEKVLITGIGLVSIHLGKKLKESGYEVFYLTRDKRSYPDLSCYEWDYQKDYIEEGALDQIDHIIHLAGANIGNGRWTKSRKKVILESRVLTSNLIYNTVKSRDLKIKSFISASAVGYYGAITSSKIYTESDGCANDFLGQTCKEWENSSWRFKGLGIRTVILRTGIVLTKEDGALAKIAKPIKSNFGAALGKGNQFVPWIHIDDLCNLYQSSIRNNKLRGVFNAVATDQITNQQLTQKIAKLLNKPLWLPNIPNFFLKLVLGEMSALILYGSRISNKKLETISFKVQFDKIQTALVSLLVKK